MLLKLICFKIYIYVNRRNWQHPLWTKVSSSTLALTYNEFHERFQMHTIVALKKMKKWNGRWMIWQTDQQWITENPGSHSLQLRLKTYASVAFTNQGRSQNLWLAMQIKIVKNTKCNEAIESHESTRYGRGRVFFLKQFIKPTPYLDWKDQSSLIGWTFSRILRNYS